MYKHSVLVPDQYNTDKKGFSIGVIVAVSAVLGILIFAGNGFALPF